MKRVIGFVFKGVDPEAWLRDEGLRARRVVDTRLGRVYIVKDIPEGSARRPELVFYAPGVYAVSAEVEVGETLPAPRTDEWSRPDPVISDESVFRDGMEIDHEDLDDEVLEKYANWNRPPTEEVVVDDVRRK